MVNRNFVSYSFFAPIVLMFLFLGGRPTLAWGIFSGIIWIIAMILLAKSETERKITFVHLFVFWLGVSVVFSREPVNSIWVFSTYLTAFVVYLVFARGLSPRAKEIFTRLAISFGFVLSLALIFGWITGTNFLPYLLPPNQNYAACVISMSFIGLVSFLFDENYPRGKKILAGLFCLIMIISLFGIKSRAALVSAFFGLVFVLFLRKKYKTIIVLSVLSVAISALASQRIIGAFVKIDDPFAFERINIWKSAIKIALLSPFSGIGLGCFERGYFLFNFPVFNGFSFYNHYALDGHSHFFHLMAETGILGGLLYVAMVLKSLIRFKKNTFGIKVSAMVLVAFINSLFNGIMFLPIILITFFALLGCLEESKGISSRQKRQFPTWVFGAFFVFCFAFAGRVYADSLLKCVKKSQKVEERQAAITRLLKIFPYDNFLYYQYAQNSLLENPPNPYKSLAFLNKAIELNPTNAVYRILKSRILVELSDYDSAAYQAKRAIRIEPNSPVAIAELVKIYEKSGQPKKSQKLERLFDMKLKRFKNHKPKSGYEEILLGVS
jgi:O-antigen ligase